MAVAQVRAGANYGGYFTKGYYGTYPRGSAPTVGEKRTFSPFLSNFAEESENFHLACCIYITQTQLYTGEGARRADPPEIVHATMIIPLTHSASRSTPYLHLQRAPLLYARTGAGMAGSPDTFD